MAYKLIGKDFTPPDVVAKVTGAAKYAEDFRAEGMVHCRLLTSPMPHARVRNIDASEALKMEGVIGILTPEDVPQTPPNVPDVLTSEPKFVGEPILAIAATSEQLAHDALERIRVDYEELPFTVDPLESLYPGGPDAVADGMNVGDQMGGTPAKTIKWTAADFAKVDEKTLPMGEANESWEYGDIEAGFAASKIIIDESFVTAAHPHMSMEPRSQMCYWENGKCYYYGSTQSQTFVHPQLARMIGIESKDLVYVAEFCGGGFGSKGNFYPLMAVPALLSKKINMPVLMRISRAEEYFLGSHRNGFQGRAKLGFAEDGRLLAADVFVVQDSGGNAGFPDYRSYGNQISLIYQPENMRWQGIPVKTNTPYRGAQRGPGYNQTSVAIEPLMDKAARELGLDRLEIRKINHPDSNSTYGGDHNISSIYLAEAMEKASKAFNWEEKLKLSGERNGSKVKGVGVGQAYHPAGFSGFDGLMRITPDGKLHIHTGIGNLGTFSHSGTSRIAAELLNYDWDNCVVVRGDSRKHLPWNIGQFGSNTSNTMTRTNYVAAQDMITKLKEITAMELGGTADDYELGDEIVVSKADSSQSMTYAAIAEKAIELGGKYDGHDMPEDINPLTKGAVSGLAGSGLIGVAKDNLPVTGTPAATVVGFAVVELDTETGKVDILEYHACTDCGEVIHPMSLESQTKSGAVMGFGMALSERLVYDPQNGLPANVGYYSTKPASYLDIATNMSTESVGLPDPDNPMGIKGVGEPVMGAGAAAVLSAMYDAMGGEHLFNRTPVTPDMIVNALAGQSQSHKPLQTNTQ